MLTAAVRRDLESLYADLVEQVRSSALAGAVERAYPIEQIGATPAHIGLASRSGKILVLPNDPLA